MTYLTTNQSALSIPSSFSVSASVTVASIAVELPTSPELNRRITNAAAAIIIIIIIFFKYYYYYYYDEEDEEEKYLLQTKQNKTKHNRNTWKNRTQYIYSSRLVYVWNY